MEWYYADKDGNQLGPVTEAQLKELIEKGDATASTMVWKDDMEDWKPLKATDLASLLKGIPPPIPGTESLLSKFAKATNFDRNDSIIHPTNPPRSPHMAWLNVLGAGLAQIVFGKTSLGILCIAVQTVFGWILNLAIYHEDGATFFFMLLNLAVFLASMVDAYMTGNRLREGQSVGKWQIFPLRDPSRM